MTAPSRSTAMELPDASRPVAMPPVVNLVPAKALTEAILNVGNLDGLGAYATSLDLATESGKAQFVGAHAGGGTPMSKLIGETIQLRDYLAHAVELPDENGEVQQCPRIVLFTEQGDMVTCVSWGILKSLKLLGAIYGAPTWSPALKVKVSQLDTKAGRRIYTLAPVAEKATRAK